MLTPEQHAMRLSGLGASEAAGALGVSRYTTPWAVWARKLGIIAGPSGWDLDRGNALEPLMLAWYADQMGVALSYPGTLRHPAHPCLLATPDGVAEAEGRAVPRWLVECKAPSARMGGFWGDQGTDQIDPEYLPQAVLQMAVTGLPRVDFVVSIGGERPILFSVQRRESLERKVIARLLRWWDAHVIGRVAPGLDGSDDVRAWLEAEHPKPDERMLEATEDFEALAEERRRLAVALKSQTDRKVQIENLTRAIIADAAGISGKFGKATWRLSEKTGRRSLRFTYSTGTNCAEEE